MATLHLFPRNPKLRRAVGLAFFLFGALTSSVVFLEVKVMHGIDYIGNPAISFAGYPYGTYQVATGLCFSELAGWTSDNPVCAFFNYDQLFYLSVAAAFIGFIVWVYYES